VLPVTNMFLFPSSYTQLTIQGNISYMFRLEEAIIRPINETIKKKVKYYQQVRDFRPLECNDTIITVSKTC